MLATTVAMAVTIFVSEDVLIIVWAVIVCGWLLGAALLVHIQESISLGVAVTESMVERFGLFTIIVLGEVVVGVVDGLSNIDRGLTTVATGILGLMLGFACWWTYFDSIGRRLPRNPHRALTRWILSHLPITLAIAGSGAAMVTLIEHAHDTRAPAITSWIITGSVALFLRALISAASTLTDFTRHRHVYQPVSVAMGIAAGISLLVGWLRPAPWLLLLILAIILSALWFFAVDRWLRTNTPNELLN